MMIIWVTILFLSLAISFYVLTRSAQEVELGARTTAITDAGHHESIGEIKKNMLNSFKHFIHIAVLLSAKYWFTFTTKTTKYIMTKWPRVYAFFQKKEIKEPVNKSLSFIERTVRESKAKVKRVREHIRAEHDME